MQPGLLMSSEPGSFAEHTLVERKPLIIRDVLASNDYPTDIVAALEALRDEIAQGTVQPLEPIGPDLELWRSALVTWQDCTWRQLPWFLAETYFYRRLLQAVGYFRPGPQHLLDPFEPQKQRVIGQALGTLASFVPLLAQAEPREALLLWLRRSLWGNRVDLSNVTVEMHGDHQVHASQDPRILLDDSAAIQQLLADGGVDQVAWIADNAGLELLSDLGLIDWLLRTKLCRRVHLHVKAQPYFVSDAMVKDVHASLAALRAHSSDALVAIGHRLSQALQDGTLVLADDPFWNTCLFFAQMPGALLCQLAQADLVVVKGDANYRRLVEDRHWPPTTPLTDVTGYLPTNLVVMRTLKSELVLGLPQGCAEALAAVDPSWMINGQRGLLQLVRPTNEGQEEP
jgi:uncharacterized protein with ATP-grasp and redox domains